MADDGPKMSWPGGCHLYDTGIHALKLKNSILSVGAISEMTSTDL